MFSIVNKYGIGNSDCVFTISLHVSFLNTSEDFIITAIVSKITSTIFMMIKGPMEKNILTMRVTDDPIVKKNK